MIEWLLNIDHFIPDDYKKTIFDIDYKQLLDDGVTTLLIDLDNTMIPYDEDLPDDRTKGLIDTLKGLGFDIVVVSNNKGPRVKRFADALDLPYVNSARKPFKKGLRRAASLAGEDDPSAVCLIGDQFMTDVWGGKRLGFRVIVVDAIKRRIEKWYTRMNRRMEKRMLARLKRLRRAIYDRLKLDEKR